ncbi:MAG TPA: nuclear transport factor 2 family protein [Polyangiaceae bacterium]|nr:nuclear transport factor 2 family protein [Polyangiaceae bacterium]
MTSDESEVLAATKRFYDAIEKMVVGEGAGPMREAWHHTPRVTSAHPTGEWARGWEEVSATWDIFATFGKPGTGGTEIRDIRVYVYGDIAYTTSVFVAAPSWGGAKLNCTNILHRVNGVWKVIHHHPDRAPSMEASLNRMVNE